EGDEVAEPAAKTAAAPEASPEPVADDLAERAPPSVWGDPGTPS
ncbi:MAG: hypothetical protein ACI80N_003345, partial [Gammaproteobacteria bacterium]